MDYRKKHADPENKNITHYIFMVGETRYAFPIADLVFQSETGLSGTCITVTNVVLDKSFQTSKVRAVTAIEVAKFLHGYFDPFKELDGKRED